MRSISPTKPNLSTRCKEAKKSGDVFIPEEKKESATKPPAKPRTSPESHVTLVTKWV